MVRKKPATSSVAVYRDESSHVDSDYDDDHLPPPRKKTRLGKEPPRAAAVPRTRRAALTEKPTNPGSSDNSFLRPIEQLEKPHIFKRKTPSGKTINVPTSGRRLAGSFGGARLIPIELSSTKGSVPSTGRIRLWESGASSTEGTITR